MNRNPAPRVVALPPEADEAFPEAAPPALPFPRPTMKHIIHYSVLNYNINPTKQLVLIRTGNLEIYMHKEHRRFVPIKYDTREPYAEDILLPLGMTNNFARWTPADVNSWADLIIPNRREYQEFISYELNGLQVYNIVTNQGAAGETYLRTLSAERYVDVNIASTRIGRLPERVLFALTIHFNRLFNLLHGFR
ncbi:Protein CBG08921 [Caenorhabditis briggsae]|uniref:Protein CBG08921 n=2 Tax=Caenorhabditis briggsae TaxID=6238 RepID=A8X7P6_CAEBR|nr:Protein CBG08921 [Caenorhabditis briggsae]CAP28657.1 Protein CBG08921 [Caenorhabditis briggsae]